MIDTLGKLLGGQSRVKVMRLFIMNGDEPYDTTMVKERTKLSIATARKECSFLFSIGFLKRKQVVHVYTKRGGKRATKRTSGFVLNDSFKYLDELKGLLVGSEFVHKDELMSRFRTAGKIKYLAVAGVFTNDDRSRLDALIVADRPNHAKLDRVIKGLEAEIGKELSYAFFDTKEFLYRASMYDKLIYDMFDFPHETLIDQDKFSTQFLRKPLFA